MDASLTSAAQSDQAPPVTSVGTGAARFFERTDWVAGGITTVIAMTIYLLTLSSDLDLCDSGVYSVGAMHPGVPTPPGYALWTIYGWLFIKLLPFSNIAWRLSVATALMAALACGVVALMVSRGGKAVAENVTGWKRLRPEDETRARVVCGAVAGLGFGFDGCVWYDAIRPDPGSLGLLLFALTLCLLMRWLFVPEQRRYLWAAAFVYGLALSNSQSLAAAVLGLSFLVAMGDRRVGREIFFGVGAICWFGLAAHHFWEWFDKYLGWGSAHIYSGIGVIATAGGLALAITTRRFFSEWKTTSVCLALLLVGLGAYFISPLLSMTNPPMNWGYPRTVEGFGHLVTRGQFEQLRYTENFERFLQQWQIFGRVTAQRLGWSYLAAAFASLFFVRKLSGVARNWLGGLWAVCIFLSALLLVGLNASPDDYQSNLVFLSVFAAPHLLLTLLAGHGLVLVAAFLTQPREPKPEAPPDQGELLQAPHKADLTKSAGKFKFFKKLICPRDRR